MNASAALLALACLAIGGGCGWLARSRWTMTRAAHDPAQPYMLTAIVKLPGTMFAEPIIGLGLEIQGIRASDVTPPTPPAGLDPGIWGGMGDGDQ